MVIKVINVKRVIGQKYFILKVFFLLLGILVLTAGIVKVLERLGYELMLPYTWDSPIYWAVGRGILNGLVPYADMYENKPPGVFLVSALSFAVTGDVYICSALSVISQIIVGITPFIAVAVMLRRRNVSASSCLSLSGAALLPGLLILMYCQNRSGQFQIETMGSAFICIYILITAFLKTKSIKLYSPSLIIAGFFLMCAVMFKEPFVIIAAVCGLCFSQSIHDALYKIVMPLIYGGIMGVMVLLFSGTLIPYLTIYLPHMTGSHISIYGSPFVRGLMFHKLFNNLGKFSGGLAAIVLISLLLFAVIRCKRQFEKSPGTVKTIAALIIFQILKITAMVYAVSFCVGLGGQYYNHHYVFAVPFYNCLIIFVLKYAYDAFAGFKTLRPPLGLKRNFLAGIFICLLIFFVSSAAVMHIGDFKANQTVLNNNKTLRQQAEYVDAVLDACDVDRYQYLGFNGDCFYGFTKHSPLGPVFIQDPKNFVTNNTWFTENMLKQLDQAEIIIFRANYTDCIKQEVSNIINKNFTIVPPNETVRELSAATAFPYTIYYRK